MINLTAYREYWERMAGRAEGLTGVMPVTLDDDMGKRIMDIRRETCTLFYLPPEAQSSASNADSWREENICVVFVMEKYDPQRRRAFEVLETSQRVTERVKDLLLGDLSAGCSPMRIDVPTINTMPETRFFAGFAGWSIGFKIRT